LWIGVRDGADDLARLARAGGQATVPLGFRPGERPYHPHLTLARSRRPRSLAPLGAMIGGGAVGPPWSARWAGRFPGDPPPDRRLDGGRGLPAVHLTRRAARAPRAGAPVHDGRAGHTPSQTGTTDRSVMAAPMATYWLVTYPRIVPLVTCSHWLVDPLALLTT